MDPRLAKARQQFKNQKVELTGGFDRSPVPDSTYPCVIEKMGLQERQFSNGDKVLQFFTQLSIAEGEHKGRKLWPWAPNMEDIEGIPSAANILQVILGSDDIPVNPSASGAPVLDISKFLEVVEDLAKKCIGVTVAVRTKAVPKKNKGGYATGEMWQHCYIQRRLDEAPVAQEAAPSTKKLDAGGSMKMPSPARKRRA